MGVLSFNGFETGDGSELPNGVGTYSVQSSVKRTGGYALKAANATAQSEIVLASANVATLYARSAYYSHSVANPATTNTSAVMIFRDTSNGLIGYVLVEHDTVGGIGVFKFYNVVSSELYTGTVSGVFDAWQVIEAKVTVSATVGTVDVKVDGVSAISVTGKNTGTVNIGYLNFGGHNAFGVNCIDDYWDDFLCRDDAWPGVGRVIARQGKAGTPTYNAWTKTSSATAATVWSETPYSATNEAHSTAASQAQTMLLADVGAGTNPAYSAATFNAARTVAIIKEIGSGLSATYSMRRRVSSADTDTAKTITASDVLYGETIWTPASLAALQGMEIGAVRGAEADVAAAAVTFVSAGAEAAGSSGPITLGAPASTAVGDILIAVIHTTDQVAHSMNATYWTQVAQGNGGGTTSRLSIWWGRIAASESRDYLVSHTAGNTTIGGVLAFRGCVSSGSPIHVAGTLGAGTDVSMETTGQTTTLDNSMLVMVHGAGNDNAITVPAGGWAARLEDSSGGTQNSYITTLGTDGMVGVLTLLKATAGVQADVTVTQGAANAWASYMFSLAAQAPVAITYKHVQVEDAWLMLDFANPATQTTPATSASSQTWTVPASVSALVFNAAATVATAAWSAPAATSAPGSVTRSATVATAAWAAPASASAPGSVSRAASASTASWAVPASTATANFAATATVATASWAAPASTSASTITRSATVATAAWATPAAAATANFAATSVPAAAAWTAPASTAAASFAASSTVATASWVAPAAEADLAAGPHYADSVAATASWAVATASTAAGPVGVAGAATGAAWATGAASAMVRSYASASAASSAWATAAASAASVFHATSAPPSAGWIAAPATALSVFHATSSPASTVWGSTASSSLSTFHAVSLPASAAWQTVSAVGAPGPAGVASASVAASWATAVASALSIATVASSASTALWATSTASAYAVLRATASVAGWVVPSAGSTPGSVTTDMYAPSSHAWTAPDSTAAFAYHASASSAQWGTPAATARAYPFGWCDSLGLRLASPSASLALSSPSAPLTGPTSPACPLTATSPSVTIEAATPLVSLSLTTPLVSIHLEEC